VIGEQEDVVVLRHVLRVVQVRLWRTAEPRVPATDSCVEKAEQTEEVEGGKTP